MGLGIVSLLAFKLVTFYELENLKSVCVCTSMCRQVYWPIAGRVELGGRCQDFLSLISSVRISLNLEGKVPARLEGLGAPGSPMWVTRLLLLVWGLSSGHPACVACTLPTEADPQSTFCRLCCMPLEWKLSVLVLLLYLACFKEKSHYVALAGLKVVILLPLSALQILDYVCESPGLGIRLIFFTPGAALFV